MATTFPVVFAHPWWLAAGAAALLPLLLAWRVARNERQACALAVALQATAILMTAIALAQPGVNRTGDVAKPFLLLEDVSASVHGQAQPLPWPPNLPRRQAAFAKTVFPAREILADERDATFLSPALQLAASQVEELSGVVIHTDGQFQDDDWTSAAARLAAKLPVTIVPMESPPADARVAELVVHRAGENRIDVRLTLRCNASQRRTVTLRRIGRAEPLLQRELDLLADDRVTFAVADRDAGDGLVEYHAELSAGDKFPRNDSAAAICPPRSGSLAVVGSGLEWLSMCGPAGLSQVVLTAAQAPATLEGWQAYSAVVLVDPSGDLLALPQRNALAEYVRSGGGLVLLGSGPGESAADVGDPLNRISPLVPNLAQRQPLRVRVVLDASGSMAEQGGRKFDLAKEAILSLRNELTPADTLEVAVFSDRVQPVYDSENLAPDFEAVQAAMAGIRPSGPTHVTPALEHASASRDSQGRSGLVLLVSDLRTEEFDAAAMAQRFHRAGWSLGVVVAPEGSEAANEYPLEKFSAAMDAPVVRSAMLTDLSTVLARFIRSHRGSRTAVGSFASMFKKEVFGKTWPNAPRLGGYIRMLLSPGAQRLAEVQGETGDEPILARQVVGLGRVVTLGLDVRDADFAWRSWPAWPALLAEAITWVARPAADPRAQVEFAREGGRVKVRLTMRDGAGPMGGLTPTLLTQTQSGASRSASMVQVGPGEYETTLSFDVGPLAMSIRSRRGELLWSGGWRENYPREFSAIGVNEENLRRLAMLTGGEILRESQFRLAGPAMGKRERTELWPLCVGLALAAMLAEWCGFRWRRGGGKRATTSNR